MCPLDEITDFDKLKYYRAEIKFQHTLIGQRLGWYTAFQSLLFAPLAIYMVNTYKAYIIHDWFVYIIAVIGIFTSIFTVCSLRGTIITTNMYKTKQYHLFKDIKGNDISKLAIPRDLLSIDEDLIHEFGMFLTQAPPILFSVIWIVIFVLYRFFPLN